MNAKTTFRVLTVVLLALALTALAAAQDEQPVAHDKALPAVIEKGESASPAATLTETEWNNNFSTANPITVGDVISGKIKGKADQDYFRIDVPTEVQGVIDIDAQVNGSALDAWLCLYDRNHVELACNDDSDGLDSLLVSWFFPSSSYAPYYVRVQDLNYPNEGGDAYTYTLSVYRPLLVSAAKNGSVSGVGYTSGDVLAHYDFSDGTEKWMLFFDASDAGVVGNVVGLADGGWWIELILSSPQTLWVDGAQENVTPYDTVFFSVTEPWEHFGPSTVGTFFQMYDGAGVGLTTSAEKLDALANTWSVSTAGKAKYLSGLQVNDEDISDLLPPELLFDGSNVSGLGAEDVVAADVDTNDSFLTEDDTYWLTILGNGVIDGHAFTQKDIFVVDPNYNVTGLYWHGPDHGFNGNIDAFDNVN
jgi:hypothetical protein